MKSAFLVWLATSVLVVALQHKDNGVHGVARSPAVTVFKATATSSRTRFVATWLEQGDVPTALIKGINGDARFID